MSSLANRQNNLTFVSENPGTFDVLCSLGEGDTDYQEGMAINRGKTFNILVDGRELTGDVEFRWYRRMTRNGAWSPFQTATVHPLDVYSNSIVVEGFRDVRVTATVPGVQTFYVAATISH